IVATDLHAIVLGEGDESVGRIEVVGGGRGAKRSPLHDVFGDDDAGLLADQRGVGGVFVEQRGSDGAAVEQTACSGVRLERRGAGDVGGFVAVFTVSLGEGAGVGVCGEGG